MISSTGHINMSHSGNISNMINIVISYGMQPIEAIAYCLLPIAHCLLPIAGGEGEGDGEGEGEGKGDIDIINTTCNKQDYLLYVAY